LSVNVPITVVRDPAAPKNVGSMFCAILLMVMAKRSSACDALSAATAFLLLASSSFAKACSACAEAGPNSATAAAYFRSAASTAILDCVSLLCAASTFVDACSY
jgi:hypothetical protein